MQVKENFDELRRELSVKCKNGIDFTSAASVVWLFIAIVWTRDLSPYNKSILTFMVGAAMLPMALLFSKLFKTVWTIKENPLQPLGLWLNFAQLFYFPFLIFVLIQLPDYFVMVYVIITGAHFFPYAWFYKVKWYAVFAGIISVGALLLGLYLDVEQMFYLPLFFSGILVVLSTLLFVDYKSKEHR